MIVIGILFFAAGLYGLAFSRSVSERARREKWPFGGNRVFTVMASVVVIAIGIFMVQSELAQIFDSERESRPVTGWGWMWIAGAIGIFVMGISQIIFADWWSSKMTKNKKRTGPLLLSPTSRRGIIGLGVFNAGLGGWWLVASWIY